MKIETKHFVNVSKAEVIVALEAYLQKTNGIGKNDQLSCEITTNDDDDNYYWLTIRFTPEATSDATSTCKTEEPSSEHKVDGGNLDALKNRSVTQQYDNRKKEKPQKRRRRRHSIYS